MNPSSELVAAVATIAAALVAGLVSFIVTVLSKEQKTSEFRQAWIDALRSDIADFVAKNALFMAAIRIQGQRANADEDSNRLAVELPKRLNWDGGATDVEELLVYSSELRRAGPEYAVLARSPLLG